MKKIILTIAILFVVGVLGFNSVYQASASVHKDKVTLCHKTHSEKNPWVEQTVNANEVESHLDNGDFVIDEGHPCPPITPTPTVPVPTIPFPTIPVPCFMWQGEFPVPCPTVTPTVAPTVTPVPCTTDCGTPPTFAGSSTNAPVCDKTAPTKVMANFHVYRKGGDAVLKWFATEGNKANIYYKQVGSPDWQYSLRDIDNTGYVEIHGLKGLDITFAGQQANDCAGGPLTTAVVDGSTKGWVLFR